MSISNFDLLFFITMFVDRCKVKARCTRTASFEISINITPPSWASSIGIQTSGTIPKPFLYIYIYMPKLYGPFKGYLSRTKGTRTEKSLSSLSNCPTNTSLIHLMLPWTSTRTLSNRTLVFICLFFKLILLLLLLLFVLLSLLLLLLLRLTTVGIVLMSGK